VIRRTGGWLAAVLRGVGGGVDAAAGGCAGKACRPAGRRPWCTQQWTAAVAWQGMAFLTHSLTHPLTHSSDWLPQRYSPRRAAHSSKKERSVS
jgi:hypothetical protein